MRVTAEPLSKKKADAMKLAIAYAYSVKNLPHDEHGMEYSDYDDAQHCD